MKPSFVTSMQRLHTPFERGEVPFSSYPRPQLKRDSYLCLNGEWSLSYQSGDKTVPVGTVIVPFPPESTESGIESMPDKQDVWIYERTFSLPEGFVKDRVILHIGAADQAAQVFVNDIEVARHEGGYLPFCCDITAALCDGENRLQIRVCDPLDTDLPYGKQCKNRGGMWYTPISGIWQTVWCESVCHDYIRSLRMTPATDSVTITICGGAEEKRLVLHGDDGDTETVFSGDSITLPIEYPQLWSPQTPYLYRFTLHAGEDTVCSYFALRTVSVGKVSGKPCILLNGKPYFFHGLLDQGYYPEGIYLPACEEGYRYDIAKMKALGFNMLRKHIKVEPEVFYYECDRQGMIVFQDLVNSGKYHYLLDTVLPTIGLRCGIELRPSARRKIAFEQSAKDTVSHLYNHPCICYYTLFNEGWGQYDADRLYGEMKQLDSTRIWDATSGWFGEKQSDVQSEHVYFKPVQLTAGERPLVLSEFGGYSCKLPDHAFNLKKTYGYRHFHTPAAFSKALCALYRDEIAAAIKNGLCAAVLTQVSDIEDEVNGLVTYDRKVCKVNETDMKQVASELFEVFAKTFGE